MIWVLVILAVLLIVAVAVFARATTQRAETLASVAELAVPVDIAALRALLDRDDDAFLRKRLPASVYRTLSRRRSRLVLAYVRLMLHNTGILLSFAATVRDHGSAEQAAIATEVIYTAMRVRLQLAAVAGRTVLDWMFPSLPRPTEAARAYAHLLDRAALLFRMLDPVHSAQAAAAL